MLSLRPFFVAFLFSFPISHAKTVFLNWDIEWVTAAPDGYARPVIGVNGEWPPPTIECDVGDTVNVVVKNSLGNETTGIHWHGEIQRGTNDMDGVSHMTQCPIPPGESYTFSFTAFPAGSHWWHSHNMGQYPDGLRAPMIVHDRWWEKSLDFDEELVLTVSDWYHKQSPFIIHDFLNTDDFAGALPAPDSSLLNDSSTVTIDFEAGKTYLIRIISMSALLPHDVYFEDHEMSIVAIDGVPIDPVSTDYVHVSAAQRYDVIVQAKSDPQRNYAIRTRLTNIPTLGNNGMIRYGPKFLSNVTAASISGNAVDDITLKPTDGEEIYGPVTKNIEMEVTYTSDNGTGQARHIVLGNHTFVSSKVPTLFTVLTTGQASTDSRIYGVGVNAYMVNSDDVVQIVVHNGDDFAHPMHLHGHRFQVVARGPGVWDGDESKLPSRPMMRDTVETVPQGHLVIRFKADNPGVWAFHCHMEWHVEAGMMATIIESPLELQNSGLTISDQSRRICRVQGIPIEGNCAGNTVDLLDTSQCNNEPDDEANWGALIVPSATPGGSGSASRQNGSANGTSETRDGGNKGASPTQTFKKVDDQ